MRDMGYDRAVHRKVVQAVHHEGKEYDPLAGLDLEKEWELIQQGESALPRRLRDIVRIRVAAKEQRAKESAE